MSAAGEGGWSSWGQPGVRAGPHFHLEASWDTAASWQSPRSRSRSRSLLLSIRSSSPQPKPGQTKPERILLTPPAASVQARCARSAPGEASRAGEDEEGLEAAALRLLSLGESRLRGDRIGAAQDLKGAGPEDGARLLSVVPGGRTRGGGLSHTDSVRVEGLEDKESSVLFVPNSAL